MKPKTLVKRLSATLLATTMAASSFSQFSIPVFAQDTTSALSKEQFATAEQLKSFNTNDTDGEKNPAKVYFGDDNQQWWIAGSQNGNLTLFAANPMDVYKMFEPNPYDFKSYDSSWNCTYVDGNVPQQVNANHYGASQIRKTLEGFVNSKFTNTEQGLMKNTTIHTKDWSNKVYFTTDILYLAFGSYGDQHITVGEVENKEHLDSGLRIDRDYWTNERFWLRAVGGSGYLALVSSPSYNMAHQEVQSYTTSEFATVVPAFALDPSSVLFGSVASAATSNGQPSINDAFVLRYKTNNLGSALISYDKSKVTLTDVPAGKGVYLVAQSIDGAKAKLITNETEVSATDLGLDSFADCKVWLETTNSDERITYATLATEEQSYDVNIKVGAGLTITSNNGVQKVAQGGAITDITVEVVDGYYLPDGYTNSIQNLNGLKVQNVTRNGFTITGTPNGDVSITLDAATKKYIVNITAGDSLVITNGSQSIERGKPITDITVKVVEGYYLPNNYKDAIQGLNGLSVKDVTESGFTISGTPTSDVNIQLPAATSKPVSGSGSGGGSTAKLNPVYRAYNPNNGEHLYTLDEKEYKHVESVGWTAEGVAFMAEEEKNGQALYRVYNPNSGLHHYTLDEKEKNTLVSLGWHDEKVAWYTSKKPQSAPVFRVYNPNDGNHHYTMNKQEKDALVLLGWHDEGLAFRTAPIEK